MAASVRCATLVGVDATPVTVEVDVAGGLPSVSIVGLADAAVREARVRVQAALQNHRYSFPAGRISVNLAPAHLRKDGTGFDLPIAIGILAAQGVIPPDRIERTMILGELSLSGDVRGVRGALAAAQAAAASGCTEIVLAAQNAQEAALVEEVRVRAVRSLPDAVRWFTHGDESQAPLEPVPPLGGASEKSLDLAEVRGQHLARRALEVAAAGGHHLLFVGGPGSGKTMLARRLPGILPCMDRAEALEVTRIQSATGLLRSAYCSQRPFRAPHHSTTPAGLIGGGSGMPRPGELTLAHRGVLFLDELPEFARPTLESLREPLETCEVMLARAWGPIRFPAAAQLVCAMNPCPCGYRQHPSRACTCLPGQVQRYRSRLSGPFLDRLDIHLEVPPVSLLELDSAEAGESSARVRERVALARKRQSERLGGTRTNADMQVAELRRFAEPDAEGRTLLRVAAERLGMSARSYARILRVARTLADLEGCVRIRAPHLQEALQYRGWGQQGAAPAA